MSLLEDLRDVAEADLRRAAMPLKSYVQCLEDSIHAHRALNLAVAVVFAALGFLIGHFGK